jgi:hypothetical protein
VYIRNPSSAKPARVPSAHTFIRWLTSRFSARRRSSIHHSPEAVKNALANLHSPRLLELSPLIELPVISSHRSAAELRALLVDVVAELTDSRVARDAEAGRLLLDYYVKRVGTHEVTMERLHLSRPTYYRRLKRGCVLVTYQLNGLCDFAERFPD